MLSAVCVFGETKVWKGPNNVGFNNPTYWEPSGDPTAEDDVVINNGLAVKVSSAIKVKSITVSGEGTRLLVGNASLAPQTIISTSGDLIVEDGAVMHVFAGELTDRSVFANAISDPSDATAAIYANPTVVSVGGTFSVSGGAVVYAENAPVTGAAVFFKPKDFVLAEDGRMDTESIGWSLVDLPTEVTAADVPAGGKFSKSSGASDYFYTFAFGAGHQYGYGAGYGGKSITTAVAYTEPVNSSWTSGLSYGSAYAPFLSGSPSGTWGNTYSRASGSIVVLATGSATIAGTMAASGIPNPNYPNIPGASGGGVWVCAETVDITATSSLCASGGICRGSVSYVNSPGGGGRISIGRRMSPSDWDKLAAANALPEEYLSIPLDSDGVLSVKGAPNPKSTLWADDGTATLVVPKEGFIILNVKSSPVEVVADGLEYKKTFVETSQIPTYSVPEYVADPSGSVGTVYLCEGWVVSNATKEIARGVGNTASFNADWRDAEHTLTWLWKKSSDVRTYRVGNSRCGAITVNGVRFENDVALPISDLPSSDEITAVPAEGCRFVGWTGLPCGFSTNKTVTVPIEIGSTITAVFESDNDSFTKKKWTNALGNNLWSAPGNWEPHGEPGSTDDVEISGSDCRVPVSALAHSVCVKPGAALLLFSTKSGADAVADNSVGWRHRHFLALDDFVVEGEVFVGGVGRAWTNMSVVIGGDLALSGNARMSVFATPLDESLESTSTNLYHAAEVVSVGGDISVVDSATLRPVCDRYTGTAVRFDVQGSFLLGAGARVDADGCGWDWRVYDGDPDPFATFTMRYPSGNDTETTFETRAKGVGYSFTIGAGYGNYGNGDWKTHPTYGRPYGYSAAPFLPGSPGGSYNASFPQLPGGGVVWLKCGERIKIDGTVSACAQRAFYCGSSGGSIWLIGRGMSVGSKALLTAAGGGTSDTQAYTSAGSGGRIAIALGISEVDMEALAMGETPEGLDYSDVITHATADVSGGPEGTKTGVIAQRYAPTGTVMTVIGPNAEKSIAISADILAGTPFPPYGISPAAPGDLISFVATDTGYGADPDYPDFARWACVGYVVSNATQEIAAGSGASFELVMPAEDIFVTWRWADRNVRVPFTGALGTGSGSLTADGATFDQEASIWRTGGDTVSLKAIPDEGSEFLYWAGDVPFGKARCNPIDLAVVENLKVRPVFRRAEGRTTRVWQKADGESGGFLDPSAWSGANIPGIEDDVVITSGVCFVTNVSSIYVGSLAVSNANTRLYVGFSSDMRRDEVKSGLAYIAGIEDARSIKLTSSLSAHSDEVSIVAARDVEVASGAQVCIGVPYFGHRAHGRLAAANLTLSGSSQIAVVAGTVEDGGDFTFASGAGFVEVAEVFSVGDTAVFRPFSDPDSGGSVKVSAPVFTLAQGAAVDARGTGFVRKSSGVHDCSAFGRGFGFYIGAGHGGDGAYKQGDPGTLDKVGLYGVAYGQLMAPVHPGSPNGEYSAPYMRGGGLVRIHSRSMSIAGRIDASAQGRAMSERYFFSGASGGGIWLTAGSFDFVPGAVLDVHGGHSSVQYESAGAGGRIAVSNCADNRVVSDFAQNGSSRGFKAMSKEKFEEEFPGVTVDVSRGVLYEYRTSPTVGQYAVDGEYTGEDGTFVYAIQTGMLFIVR